jgi:hypothetical protein
MDSLNVLIAEMQIKARQLEATKLSDQAPVRPELRGGIKRALATTFVRLGLRLDPAAGERLGALSVTLAGQERGC